MAKIKQLIVSANESANSRVRSVANEVELWKLEHDIVMLMSDLEEIVKKYIDDMIFAYERIVGLDEFHRLMVAKKEMAWSDEVDLTLTGALRQWVVVAKEILKVRTIFDKAEFSTALGDDHLAALLREAQAILNPDYMALTGNMAALAAQALEENRARTTEEMP